MDENTKQMVWTLLKVGLVGTAIGVPVGVWAMKRWDRPGETWKTAVLLTALGFGVKEVMLRSSHAQMEEAVAEVEQEGAMAAFAANPYTCPYGGPRRARGAWGGAQRGIGAYMPAPGMPPSPHVYYPNLKNKANGRPAIQSGLNPTAL